MQCNGDDHDEYVEAPAPRLFHASASYSVFGSDLSVDAKDAFMERRAVTAGLSYRFGEKITGQIGAGATLGGRFVFADTRFSLDPGWIVSAGATYRLLGGAGTDWFVLMGGAVAASGGVTRDAADRAEDMYAIDLRLTAIAGRTFFDVLSPYLVGRAFGGPILWRYDGRERLGTDKYHFQIGAGLLVTLPAHFDVFAEAVPLGERAAVAGAGYSF